MYWLGLLTHLQCPEVPLKNLASLRDLVAMYEAAKVEDLYDALASFSLDDESVFTCIGVSGKTPPAQKDFQEQNKGNLLNAQVGRRNLCFAVWVQRFWAGNEEIGSCMPSCTWPQHQPCGRAAFIMWAGRGVAAAVTDRPANCHWKEVAQYYWIICCAGAEFGNQD